MRISDWSSDVCSSDLPQCDPLSPLQDRRSRRSAQLLLAGRAAALPCRHRPARERRARCRSEERRVGKEGVSTCRSRGSPENEKNKHSEVVTERETRGRREKKNKTHA